MKATSPLWYLAAFLLALGSWMIATIVASGAWDPVRDVSVTPARDRIATSGESLAVFTDILQPDRSVTCRVKGPGKKVTDVPKAALEITVDDEGNEWHLIGLLNEPTMDRRVSCRPKDRRVDDATYAYATVDGFVSRANTGKGIAILGSAGGAGLAAYTFYIRRRRRKDMTADA